MMGFRDFCVWFWGEGIALCLLGLQTVAMWELHFESEEILILKYISVSFLPFFPSPPFYFKLFNHEGEVAASFSSIVFFVLFFSFVHRVGLLFVLYCCCFRAAYTQAYISLVHPV